MTKTNPFDSKQLQHELRLALTLKADDLLFTLGGDEGRRLQAAFLGTDPFDGLATDFDEAGLAEIDLSGFAIAEQVAELAEFVGERSWGPIPGDPDTESQRYHNLEFLEHFLTTLPTVALGGWDATSVRFGVLRDLYLTGYAWLSLVDAIAAVFRDDPDLYSVELEGIARLSGRDLRTIRNQAGPTKPLRTTPERQLRHATILKGSAFVTVHTFDAVDWLVRRGFEFQPLDLARAQRRISDGRRSATKARSLLMLALINLGARSTIASILDCSEDCVRAREDGAEALSSADERSLRAALNL